MEETEDVFTREMMGMLSDYETRKSAIRNDKNLTDEGKRQAMELLKKTSIEQSLNVAVYAEEVNEILSREE